MAESIDIEERSLLAITDRNQHDTIQLIGKHLNWQGYKFEYTSVDELMRPLSVEVSGGNTHGNASGYLIKIAKQEGGEKVIPLRQIRDAMFCGLKALGLYPRIHPTLTLDSIQVMGDSVWISRNALDSLCSKLQETPPRIQQTDIISRNTARHNSTSYLQRFVDTLIANLEAGQSRSA